MEASDVVLEISEKINKLKLIKYHKQIAKRQRQSYNNMLIDVNLFEEGILIEMDFKQKVLIGMSPRQVSSEYYKQQLRNVLG